MIGIGEWTNNFCQYIYYNDFGTHYYCYKYFPDSYNTNNDDAYCGECL